MKVLTILFLYGNLFGQISDIAWQRYEMLGRGINAQGWLTHIHNTSSEGYREYSNRDFQLMSEFGFNHVRLKADFAHWWNYSDSVNTWDFSLAPTYTDSSIFDYTDLGISFCRDNNLIVNLNYYNWAWDDTMLNANTYTYMSKTIGKQWRDIANHYKYLHPDSLFYEIYNEPGSLDSYQMRIAFKTIIDSIRTVDSTHTIIVWGNVDSLALLEDDNIIPTIHFYEPWIFVNQGKCFGSFPIETTGIPFPYDSLIFAPDSLEQTDQDTGFIFHQWLDYMEFQGNVDYVQDWIYDTLAQHAEDLNVPLYLGEWGATNGANTTDLLFYLKTVRESFDTTGINWALYNWKGAINDSCSNFTMFNNNIASDSTLFTDDSGYSILCALGLETCSVLGDVNQDGEVNILDIIIAVDFILANEYNGLADMNSDEVLDITDIIILVGVIIE